MSDLSADAKALIQRGRLEDAPRVEDKARIRERLRAQLGAAAFAAAGEQPAQSADGSAFGAEAAAQQGAELTGAPVRSAMGMLRGGVTRWLAVVAASGGLAWGGYLLMAPQHAPKATPSPIRTHAAGPAGTPIAASAPREASAEEAEAPPPLPATEPTRGQPPAALSATEHPPKRARKSRQGDAPAFQPIGTSSTMSAEIALLAKAQQALRVRDGHEALRMARQHAENFPSGALYEERLGVEAIAHCLLGERDHASVRAFLARAPRSPLSARVRKECAVP